MCVRVSGKSCNVCEQHTGSGLGDESAMLVASTLKLNTSVTALFMEGL